MNYISVLICFLPLYWHVSSSTVKGVLESQDRPLVYINNSVIGVLETNDGPELAGGGNNPDEVPSLVIDNSLINTLKAPILSKGQVQVSHSKPNPDTDMLPPPPMFDEPGEPLGPLPQPIISVEPKPQPPPPPPDQQTVNSIGQLLGASIFQEPQGLIPQPESLIPSELEPTEEPTTKPSTTTTSDVMEQVFAEVVNEESTAQDRENYDNFVSTTVSTKKPISTAAFTNIMNQLKAIMNMNGLSSFVISEPGIGTQLDRQLDKVRELEKRGKTTTKKSEASLFAQKRGNVTSRFQTRKYNPIPVKKSIKPYANQIHRRSSNPFGSEPSAISKRGAEPTLNPSLKAFLKRELSNHETKHENEDSLDKRIEFSAVPSALKLDRKDDSNILITSGLKNVLRNFGTPQLSSRLSTTKVGDIDKEERRSKNGTDGAGLGTYVLRKSGSIHGSVSKLDLDNDKRASSESDDAAKLAKMYFARHLNNKEEDSKEQEK